MRNDYYSSIATKVLMKTRTTGISCSVYYYTLNHLWNDICTMKNHYYCMCHVNVYFPAVFYHRCFHTISFRWWRILFGISYRIFFSSSFLSHLLTSIGFLLSSLQCKRITPWEWHKKKNKLFVTQSVCVYVWMLSE